MARRLLPAIAFLSGLLVRGLPAPTLFASDRVHLPFAGDAYYHLRRIQYTVAHFPETIGFDPYVSFPNGSEIFWPAVFDWTLAGLIRALVGAGDPHAVERLAVWAPAILGAATAAAVAWLATRAFGSVAGWVAGLLYAGLPMSFQFSQIGMIDHHVAIALLSAFVLAALHALVEGESEDEALGTLPFDRATGRTLALGLLLGGLILTWPGGLLHLAVTQLVLAGWWLGTADRGTAYRRGRRFVLVHGVVLAVVSPFALGRTWREYGRWSPLVLDDFQPLYLASALVVASLAVGLHARTACGRDRTKRVVSAVVLAGAGGLAVLAAVPALRDSVVGASGWFAEGHALLGVVHEMKPLLATTGGFNLGFPVDRLGAVFLAFPAALGFCAWTAWREQRPGRLALCAWGGGFLLFALAQWRFANTLTVPYALITGAALQGLWARWRRGASRPIWLAPASLVAVALVLWTAHQYVDRYAQVARRSRAALERPGFAERGPLRGAVHNYAVAGDWLRANTPETAGYDDTSVQPEYGVLTSWGTGHLLRYRSRRPMIVDNFGPFAGAESFSEGWRYFTDTDEDVALARMARVGARYVVADARGHGVGGEQAPRSMTARLATAWGSRRDLAEGRAVPGLARHRLVFHAFDPTDPANRGRPLRMPRVGTAIGIWEIVPGAAIEGRAEPGERVHLALGLETGAGVEHVYRRQTRADERGRYRLVVPYPTDVSFSSAVRVRGRYRLSAGRRLARVVVGERAIRRGGRIAGPDFAPAPDVATEEERAGAPPEPARPGSAEPPVPRPEPISAPLEPRS